MVRYARDGINVTSIESSVSESALRKGVGQAGSIHIPDLVWNACVPRDFVHVAKQDF